MLVPLGELDQWQVFYVSLLATWFTGVAGLVTLMTSQPFLDPSCKTNTAWAVDSLFGLIGLDYAREGAKAPDFSPLQDVGDTG